MNIVQRLDMDKVGPVICTLNPTIALKEELIQARGEFEHPMFNAEVRPIPFLYDYYPNP
jgi:hypothetical protein